MSDALTVLGLQIKLQAAGFFAGIPDGDWNDFTVEAMDAALSSGNHDRLSASAIASAASRLLLTPETVGACYDVESAGRGFDPDTGRLVVRFEPHIFQKHTSGRFDATHPNLSHSFAQRTLYLQPASNSVRWGIIYSAAILDADAAFSSASYGLFQVMGFNFAGCGYPDLWTFMMTMAASEAGQLNAFCGFLKNEGLVDKLRNKDWAGYADRYNGPGFDAAPGRANDYDVKLANAYAARGGK